MALFDPSVQPSLLAPTDPRYQAWVKDQVASGAMPSSAALLTPRWSTDTPFVPGQAPVPQANQMTKSRYTLPELHQLSTKVGFAPDKAPLAAAIMMAESGGNPYAAKEDKVENSYGLPQINADAWGPVAKTALGDPEVAAKLMFDISKGGTDFSPWSTYKSGAYKQYLGASTGNNKNMALPPFGNARALASLMPATATPPGAETVPLDMSANVSGASAMGAGGAGDINTPIGTPQITTGGDYGGGSSATDPNDPMASIKALLSGGGGGLGYNPSKMLANMSAGFFGGNGSLGASLAGGFGGLAKSQQEDQSEMGKLAQMSMMYGPLLQQKIEQQKQQAAASLAGRANLPLGQAYKAVGLPPAAGYSSYEDMDAQSRAAAPLPATAQKTVQDASSNILTQRNNQIQLKTIRDQVANGDFNLDFMHQEMYKWLNRLGMPTEASSKYQAMQQTLEGMRSDLMNAQKGASSDKRADIALAQLTGGGGITSNAQAVNHFDFLGNHAALAEKNLRQKMQQAYTLSKQKMPADFMEQLDGTLPASPYQGQDPNVIGKQLYGDNTTNPNATAAPGQPLAGNTKPVVPSLKTTPSGVKYQVINP